MSIEFLLDNLSYKDKKSIKNIVKTVKRTSHHKHHREALVLRNFTLALFKQYKFNEKKIEKKQEIRIHPIYTQPKVVNLKNIPIPLKINNTQGAPEELNLIKGTPEPLMLSKSTPNPIDLKTSQKNIPKNKPDINEAIKKELRPQT